LTTSPFGPIKLIVNPRAGRGSIGKQLGAISDALRDEDLTHEVALTDGPGHATALTRTALADGYRFIASVGGDGTVHEVVNGLMDDDGPLEADAVLGVIPSGTGCDFARTFGIRQNPVEAARGLSGTKLWGTLDIPRITYRDASGEPATRWFVNIAETGIGVAVVRSAARMPRWFGGRAYRLAALRGIISFAPQEVSVRMNGRKARGRRDAPMEDTAHAARVTMVVIANGQFFGGGLRVAPRAIPSDGLLDVLVGEGTKLQALTALRKMPLGAHVPAETFSEYLADRIELEGTAPVWIEADGEVLGTTPASIDVVAGALQMKA
jgi:YegS/Rv2252/BmrU family lipid kinase